MADASWSTQKRWRNGRIGARLALPFYVTLGFAVVWNLLTLPLVALQWDELLRLHDRWRPADPASFDPKLILLALPGVNLLLLKPLVSTWRKWQRYGRVFLTLDPYPGSVGGQIGGYLTIPTGGAARVTADVRISCIKVSWSRSGKQNSRSERVLWRRRARVRVQSHGRRRAQVEFVANVEPDLPDADVARSGGHHYWAVRVIVRELGFDEVFDIPVSAEGGPRGSAIRIEDAGDTEKRADALPAALADVRDTETGFAVLYPPGRSGMLGLVLAAVGLVLAAGAVFMWSRVYAEWVGEGASAFAMLVNSVIATGFSLFGIALTLGGWFVRSNQLAVILDGDWLLVERRAFGRRFKTLIAAQDLHALDKKISAQSGQGGRANIYYSLVLTTVDGRRITVGDGIPGQPEADALLDFMHPRLRFHARRSGQAPAAEPYWLPAVRRLFGAVAGLLMVATLAAFAADFIWR